MDFRWFSRSFPVLKAGEIQVQKFSCTYSKICGDPQEPSFLSGLRTKGSGLSTPVVRFLWGKTTYPYPLGSLQQREWKQKTFSQTGVTFTYATIVLLKNLASLKLLWYFYCRYYIIKKLAYGCSSARLSQIHPIDIWRLFKDLHNYIPQYLMLHGVGFCTVEPVLPSTSFMKQDGWSHPVEPIILRQ